MASCVHVFGSQQRTHLPLTWHPAQSQKSSDSRETKHIIELFQSSNNTL